MRGDSRHNPAVVFPTGQGMNPSAPTSSPFYDKKQTAYVLFMISELRTRPTRVFTSFGLIDGWKIGTVIHLQHYQTNFWLGEYKIVGIYDFASGETVGDIPNYKIKHSVAA